MSKDFDRDAQQAVSTTASAGKASAKSVKGAKKAVKNTVKVARLAAKNPYATLVIVLVVVGVMLIGEFTGGIGQVPMNGETGINMAQDPVEEYAFDDLSDAQKNEIEAVNILGKVLSTEKADVEQKLENQAKKEGVDVEATLQMFDANYVTAGAEYLKKQQGQYTEDQYDASVMLSAYSLSVNNLWHWNEDFDYRALAGDIEGCDLKTVEGRATYIYLSLRKDGFTAEAACAVLGNLEKENSAFDPKVGEKGGPGKGLVQWTKGSARWKGLLKLANKNGTKWDDFKTQVEFMIKELDGGESGWVSGLKNCHTTGISNLYCDSHGYKQHRGYTPKKFKRLTDIGQATCMIRNHYERCGTGYESQKVSARLASARKWYNKLKNTNVLDYTTGSKGGINGAIEWAKKIANDNDFAYGSPASRAQQPGCYFCGTTITGKKHAKNKKDKWAKTYCCNTFITAAFAHGAKDPAVLKICKKGSCLGMKPSEWTRTKSFKYVGRTVNVPFSQLQAGDVIMADPSSGATGAHHNHVWMYIGGNKYVEASGIRFSADSIAVKNGAKKYYTKTFQKKGRYVVRYIGKGTGSAAVTSSASSNTSAANKALKWAKKIANDNDYIYKNYGGCHTCNSKYGKGYVCDQFVKAAYAHGAGDAEAKKWCDGSANVGGVTSVHNAMKKSKNWKSLGAIPQSKMQPGDVIFWGGGHVELYAGNGNRIGAHNSGYSKDKQISILPMYDNYSDVMRYKGSGSGTTLKTYSKYHKLKEIKKSDLKSVCTIHGVGAATCPQGFTYMGNKTYAVAYKYSHNDSTSAYITKWKKNKCIETSPQLASKLKHNNGLAYRKDNDTLYSVSGYNNNTCWTLDAETLGKKKLKSISMPNSGGSIAYDEDTGKFYLGSGNTIRVLGKKLKTVKKTIKKMGAWRYAQDQGGKDGIIYSIVSNYPNKNAGKNRINMYSAKDGSYYGSYEINQSMWEIEGCDVDETGHLLICVNIRGANTDHIYRTKKALALNESDATEDDDEAYFAPGNWRYDMHQRLTEYLEKEDLYTIKYDEDKDGKIKRYVGAIDVSKKVKKNTDEYQKDAGKEDLIETDDSKTTDENAEKLRNLLDPSVDQEELNKLLQDSNINSDIKQDSKNTLRNVDDEESEQPNTTTIKRKKYIKATIEKKDVMQFSVNAFGVSDKDVEKFYGNTKTHEALDQMAKGEIAVLHDVDDFELDIYDINGQDTNKYKIADEPFGKYKIETYCGCDREECVAKRKEILDWTSSRRTSPKRVAGVTCATPKDIPLDAVLSYSKSKGHLLVVDDHLKDRHGDTIYICTGTKHSTAKNVAKELKKKFGKKKHAIYLVSGLTSAEARNIGASNGSGVASGTLKWPLKNGANITSGFGHRSSPGNGVGSTNHAGIDIGVPVGTNVLAADGGTVVRAGWYGGYGNCVDIDHHNGIMTRYGHLSKILVGVGDRVSKGQVIAKSGNTGASTGPHLHFEVQKDGKPINPLNYVKKP